jgi:hypothetical protein
LLPGSCLATFLPALSIADADVQKSEYHKRPHIEAVYSFLKTQYSLAMNKVRGLINVTSYALYSPLCLILNREAAENFGRADKAVSPTYFNT